MSTKAGRKRRSPDPQQLTLFVYQTKKSTVASGSKSSDCGNESDEDDNDATVAISKTKATVGGNETVCQDNRITLDKPTGSITIIDLSILLLLHHQLLVLVSFCYITL